MQCIIVDNIVRIYSLNRLKLILVLANAANCNAQAVVEGTIGYLDVCAICLHGEAIITIDNYPSVEGNVRGADGVSSISVC